MTSRLLGGLVRRPMARLGRALAVASLLVALGSIGAVTQGPAGTGPASVGTPATQAPQAAIDTGDPRSDGQGPGLVGEPLLVLLGILVVGVATVIVTVVLARATGRA